MGRGQLCFASGSVISFSIYTLHACLTTLNESQRLLLTQERARTPHTAKLRRYSHDSCSNIITSYTDIHYIYTAAARFVDTNSHHTRIPGKVIIPVYN